MSKDYDGGNTVVVAAKSVKQAYYLVGHNQWFDGEVGILEERRGEKWRDFRGVERYSGLMPFCNARPLSKSLLAKFAKPIFEKQLEELLGV